MADLTVLIRLHKHDLDEKRLALGKLYEAQALIERERAELDLAFEREKEAAAHNNDIHFTFANYVEKVMKHRENLDERNAALEEQIQAAKDSLMETFSELKKYEMTQKERKRLEEEEQAVKESRELDEIGIEGHRRKGEE